ncbi:MAG: hypothetical protein ACYS0I_10955 [Planctomycetota bacterium]|jgi:hypothetical protein
MPPSAKRQRWFLEEDFIDGMGGPSITLRTPLRYDFWCVSGADKSRQES